MMSKHRAQQIKQYGLTLSEYGTIMHRQNYRCLICRTSFDDAEPCVDHNHVAGEVLGILCHRCNLGIGLAEENVDILKRAAQYLAGANNG